MTQPAHAIDQGFHRYPGLPAVEVRTTRGSVRPYATHLHRTVSVGVVFAGRVDMGLAGGRMTLGPGDVVVVPPDAPHSCNPVDGQPRSFHMFHLDPDWPALRTARPARDPFAALCRLAAAMADGRRDDAGLAALAGTAAAGCAPGRDKAVFPAVAKALLDGDAGVASVAACFAMPPETFIRRFRREAGITPGSYQTCLKLLDAYRRLRDGDDIAMVAAGCGFADQSHLHRLCVRYFAATPGQIRGRINFVQERGGANA